MQPNLVVQQNITDKSCGLQSNLDQNEPPETNGTGQIFSWLCAFKQGLSAFKQSTDW